MDPLLELPRERQEADEVRTPQPKPEREPRADAYVFDGWTYEPLKLDR